MTLHVSYHYISYRGARGRKCAIAGALYRLLVNQAHNSFSGALTTSAKALGLAWALLCMLIVALYPADLVGTFTIARTREVPFGSFTEMAAAGFKLGVFNQSAQHSNLQLIANVNDSEGQALKQVMLFFPAPFSLLLLLFSYSITS